MSAVHGIIRWMANRPSMGAQRDCSGGRIPSEQVPRLQQLESCHDAMTVPEVAGEVRLYRVIQGRYGRHEQRKQPESAYPKCGLRGLPLRRAWPGIAATRC